MLSSTARIAELLLNFTIVAFMAAICLFVVAGPVDFTLSDHLSWAPGVSLIIGDLVNPVLALFLTLAARGGFYYFRRDAKAGVDSQAPAGLDLAGAEFGPPVLTFSLALSAYLLFANVYQPWKLALEGLNTLRSHNNVLAKAATSIPPQATVYATAGAYYELFENRGSKILAGVDSALDQAQSGNVHFVVDTFLGKLRKESEALDLMRRPGFHLIFASGGVYVFAPGKKGKLDLEVYSSDFLKLHAEEAEHQVGELSADPASKAEKALLAQPGKDKPGFLVYGKYMTLKQGHHQAVFRLMVDHKTPDVVVELDVATDHGKTIVAKQKLRGDQFKMENQWEEIRLPFDIAEGGIDTAQLRVFYVGGARLYFSSLTTVPDSKTYIE